MTTAGGQPPLLLVLLGAAALGGVMGAVLGAAQASSPEAPGASPWRWIAGSTAGWTVAMPVIFLGATTVPASWPWWMVVASRGGDRARGRPGPRSGQRVVPRLAATAQPGTTVSFSSEDLVTT